MQARPWSIVEAAVHGSGYERIAVPGCSDRTIRRRLAEGAKAGLAQKLHALALAAYDQMIGLKLEDLTADGCITKGGRRSIHRKLGGYGSVGS